MADESTEIIDKIKHFILSEFLPGEDPNALDKDTPLISNAILDSIATIKLVNYLEEHYDVHFEPHEMSFDYVNTIADITATIRKKLAVKG
jgi:acyl carrier protein